jgi:hypothetical protein
MFAFWFSLALAIALDAFFELPADDSRRRLAVFLGCLLVSWGYFEVRLKQSALIASGSYVWGTSGMDHQQIVFRDLSQLLPQPGVQCVVLSGFPWNNAYYTAMVQLIDPALSRVLTYDGATHTVYANDVEGARAHDGLQALSDVASYNWTVPVSPAQAAAWTASPGCVWLQLQANGVHRVHPLSLAGR